VRCAEEVSVKQFRQPKESTLYSATSVGSLRLVQKTLDKFPEELNYANDNYNGTTCLHLNYKRFLGDISLFNRERCERSSRRQNRVISINLSSKKSKNTIPRASNQK
jgi:hypothetical protein